MDQDSIRDFFERNKRTLNGLKLLGVVLVIALLFAGAVWLAGLLLPITIGLLLSTIVEPLIRALKKIGVKRKWATIVGAVLLGPLVIVWYVIGELGSLLEHAVNLGAPVPGWLTRLLAVSQAAIDAAGDKLVGEDPPAAEDASGGDGGA